MEIRELRAFVAVVEEGGVSAAARRLHLSQSALSQVVQSLERQLGVQLLTRSHSGTTPTAAGELLVRRARAILADHDDAVAELTALGDSGSVVAGSIRVGVPLELPLDVLPSALAELRAAHPATQVEVRHASSAGQVAALENGDLDLALVRYRPVGGRFDAMLVVREPIGVLLDAGRSESLAEPSGVPLDRLAGMNWLAFPRSDAPPWYDEVSAILRTHGLVDQASAAGGDPPVTAEVKFAAVRAGRSFTLAPPGWATSLPEGIHWHPIAGHPIVRRTWAIWPATSRQRDLATLVAAFQLPNGGG
ncbi:LysR family transcriptional regulator [Kribbella pittospori]|uniref:LysR family transcriptional regulator n=1 Tax=Kribbella pittospori TaxID=722689 RepID=A0A4R0KI70_9ACTN|nr:LysR family transcriptional regulator [Kribbella pittospori]TCC57658.1 LysR family transcriptional regulator [Kribbella pittospori]